MAQLKSNPNTTVCCKYWKQGRSCYAARTEAGCRFYHDPSCFDKHICHKWQKNVCKHGCGCWFLHKEPGGPRAGCEPGHVENVPEQPQPKSMPKGLGRPRPKPKLVEEVIEKVREQMKRDREELDLHERQKKWKGTYLRCFHPDKMLVETLRHDSNLIAQEIAALKPWYLREENA